MSATLNNESGAAPSECCWPACVGTPFSDSVPLCGNHFIESHRLYLRETRRLGLDTKRPPSPQWLERVAAEAAEREARRLNRREAESQVYYVQIHDRIKIGYTKHVKARMAQLRTHPRFVLATEPGGRETEKLRHREFAGLRDGRKEEFFPHERLMRHIDLIRETYGPPRIT